MGAIVVLGVECHWNQVAKIVKWLCYQACISSEVI